MRKWAKNTGRAALVAAGAVVAGAAFGSAGTAAAATPLGDFGGLYGDARHGGGGGGEHGGDVLMNSVDNIGLANGNQFYMPNEGPISVCGNATALLGDAAAQCEGNATIEGSPDERGGPDVTQNSSGNIGVLNGNQFYMPNEGPISVCGNSFAALLASAEAACEGNASIGRQDEQLPPTLRTPKKHKTYKPGKHRPAAGTKPLPSTHRGGASRLAAHAPGYRHADGLPAVQSFLDTLKRRGASVPDVGVESDAVGPVQLADEGRPLHLGTPVLG
ncbi:hypothetical protein E1200_31835 [Actinomadura sp. GC306]|uniref:hypothetical protein n=1 Tax=Actinomadura sp. GC306 TaxID=2530367 RepID=UPI00104EB5C5|nr:hypothetical protein [Actinomadura sp. GC306]TDC59595.1 hypothetical protein E1200_31835 [Actinomadura sp. GC306]